MKIGSLPTERQAQRAVDPAWHAFCALSRLRQMQRVPAWGCLESRRGYRWITNHFLWFKIADMAIGQRADCGPGKVVS